MRRPLWYIQLAQSVFALNGQRVRTLPLVRAPVVTA
jgi:hypothetical protein